MTLEIKQVDSTDSIETVATYEDGEFSGDEAFIELYADLEGSDEEEVAEQFDGPLLVATRPEEA